MNLSSRDSHPNTLPPSNAHEITQLPPSGTTHSPHSTSLKSKLDSLASNIDFKTNIAETYSQLLSDYGALEHEFSQNLHKILSHLTKTIKTLPPAPQTTNPDFRSDFSEPLTLFASFLKSKARQKSNLAEQVASTLQDLSEFLKNSTEHYYLDQLQIFDDSYKDLYRRRQPFLNQKKLMETGKPNGPVLVGDCQYSTEGFLLAFERIKREKKCMGKGVESLVARIVSSEGLFMGSVRDS